MRWLATPKRRRFAKDHDKPRRMGVASHLYFPGGIGYFIGHQVRSFQVVVWKRESSNRFEALAVHLSDSARCFCWRSHLPCGLGGCLAAMFFFPMKFMELFWISKILNQTQPSLGPDVDARRVSWVPTNVTLAMEQRNEVELAIAGCSICHILA